MSNQLIVLKANPPIPLNIAHMTGRIASVIVAVVERTKADAADTDGEAPGFRFVLHHIGHQTQVIGTYVGFPVRGEIHTAEGSQHEVEVLVKAEMFAQ